MTSFGKEIPVNHWLFHQKIINSLLVWSNSLLRRRGRGSWEPLPPLSSLGSLWVGRGGGSEPSASLIVQWSGTSHKGIPLFHCNVFTDCDIVTHPLLCASPLQYVHSWTSLVPRLLSTTKSEYKTTCILNYSTQCLYGKVPLHSSTVKGVIHDFSFVLQLAYFLCKFDYFVCVSWKCVLTRDVHL